MGIFSRIRDSVFGLPKVEPVDTVEPLEQMQIEVQESGTDVIRNNYLMRDYLMSLSDEERQRYLDAQSSNPAIQEYKKTIGLDKNIKGKFVGDFSNPKKPGSLLQNKL